MREWESHFENMVRIFDENLSEFTPDNLLDVGCGSGDRTVRIAQYFKIDPGASHGVDYNERHVLKCRETFSAEVIDLESMSLPYPGNTFDLVVCNQVLEHLKNYKGAISEIIRVTRKDGYIVLGIPNLAHLINRIYLLAGLQPICIDVDSTHVRGFAHKAFVRMLNSWETVRLVSCEGSLLYPLPFRAARLLSRFLTGLTGYTCYLLQKVR